MKTKANETDLVSLVADLREDTALALVRQQIKDGEDLLKILHDCQKGLFEVGKRYEKRRYYVSALIMAGEIMNQVCNIIQPLLTQKQTSTGDGVILLGTVQGDIHYLGKDLFKVLASCQGFTVRDLGVDIAPQQFLDVYLELKPDIVGMSCLLQLGHQKLQDTIGLIRGKTTSKKKQPAFIIGGIVDQTVCEHVNADYFTSDAMEGVRICQAVMGNRASH